MQNIIDLIKNNHGRSLVMGISGSDFEVAFECTARVEINGDDMIIGEDDDHYIKIKNFKKWGVVNEGCDFILNDSGEQSEILLCIS